jgi:hypothetical protein
MSMRCNSAWTWLDVADVAAIAAGAAPAVAALADVATPAAVAAGADVGISLEVEGTPPSD